MFKKGVSGNPKGYPRGQPRKLTVRLAQIIRTAAPKIIKGIVDDAEKGDPEARKLFLKLLPHNPARVLDPMKVAPPETLEDLRKLSATLAAKVLAGEVDIETAKVAGSLLQAESTAIIGVDLAIAVAQLKQKRTQK